MTWLESCTAPLLRPDTDVDNLEMPRSNWTKPVLRARMFLDPKQFEFVSHLEANWRTIRAEFEKLTPHDLMPWPEKDLYNQGWDVFGLWAVDQRLEKNCDLCPQTAAILETIPGLTMGGFSALAPGTRIEPHVGYTSTVLRCHLGLDVPGDCALRVGGETRAWEEGKCLIFDDTVEHSAWNLGVRTRIVLLIDFVKPGSTFEPIVSEATAAAIQSLREK